MEAPFYDWESYRSSRQPLSLWSLSTWPEWCLKVLSVLPCECPLDGEELPVPSDCKHFEQHLRRDSVTILQCKCLVEKEGENQPGASSFISNGLCVQLNGCGVLYSTAWPVNCITLMLLVWHFKSTDNWPIIFWVRMSCSEWCLFLDIFLHLEQQEKKKQI